MNLSFATFSLCVGDNSTRKGRIVSIFRHFQRASLMFCLDESSVHLCSSFGDWSDFYTGDQLCKMLMQCSELNATEKPPTDDLILPLAVAICQVDAYRQIEHTMRFGDDSVCRLAINAEGNDQSVWFLLKKQSPGGHEFQREVDFLIQHTPSETTARLNPPSSYRHFATREEVPFLTVSEQVELLITVSRLR